MFILCVNEGKVPLKSELYYCGGYYENIAFDKNALVIVSQFWEKSLDETARIILTNRQNEILLKNLLMSDTTATEAEVDTLMSNFNEKYENTFRALAQ